MEKKTIIELLTKALVKKRDTQHFHSRCVYKTCMRLHMNNMLVLSSFGYRAFTAIPLCIGIFIHCHTIPIDLFHDNLFKL